MPITRRDGTFYTSAAPSIPFATMKEAKQATAASSSTPSNPSVPLSEPTQAGAPSLGTPGQHARQQSLIRQLPSGPSRTRQPSASTSLHQRTADLPGSTPDARIERHDPGVIEINSDTEEASTRKRPAGSSPPEAGQSVKRTHVVISDSDEEQPQVVAAAAQAPAPAELTKTVKGHINRIVNFFTFKSEKQAARNEIEQKLGKMPANEHVTTLLGLITQLSAPNVDKKAKIAEWVAKPTTIADIVSSSDMRKSRKCELQDALAREMANPEFKHVAQEINQMIPFNFKARHVLTDPSIKNGNYNSVLFRRVFADSRGPLTAINAIWDHLLTMDKSVRYAALKSWKPEESGDHAENGAM